MAATPFPRRCAVKKKETPGRDAYRSHSEEELAVLPTVYREGLFDGKVVLISGGAGGIGTAASMLFGRLGATVAVCGRDPERLAGFGQVMARQAIACSTHAMTIRDPEQVSALMDAV